MTTTTFTCNLFTPPVQITIPTHLTSTLTQSDLESLPAFRTWSKTLSHSLSLQTSSSSSSSSSSHPFASDPYKLKSISIQSADRFGKGESSRLGFVKVKAEVKNAAGESLPGVAMLRGGSVGMLVIIQPDDDGRGKEEEEKPEKRRDEGEEGEKYVVLTVQARVAAGSLAFAELPAGMLDDSGTFGGAAAKELKEEAGLEIEEDDLVDLTALALAQGRKQSSKGQDAPDEQERLQEAMYPSAGGSDEFIPLFLHQRRVPRDKIKDWQGKLTGLREHGEKITLRLVRFEDLWWEAARDAKALGALALYNGLRQAGRIDAQGKVVYQR